MSKKDDWEKPRGRHSHFTEDEREFIRKSFKTGTKAADVARALKCSTRTINIHYAELRAAYPNVNRAPADRDARHYKSNFEL